MGCADRIILIAGLLVALWYLFRDKLKAAIEDHEENINHAAPVVQTSKPLPALVTKKETVKECAKFVAVSAELEPDEITARGYPEDMDSQKLEVVKEAQDTDAATAKGGQDTDAATAKGGQDTDAATAKGGQDTDAATAKGGQDADEATAKEGQDADEATAKEGQDADEATAKEGQDADEATAKEGQDADEATAKEGQDADEATAKEGQDADEATAKEGQDADEATAKEGQDADEATAKEGQDADEATAKEKLNRDEETAQGYPEDAGRKLDPDEETARGYPIETSEDLATTVNSLVTNPAELVFPVSQLSEKRVVCLKNDTEVIKPKDCAYINTTLKGSTDLKKDSAKFFVFCLPMIHIPGSKHDFTINPNDERTLKTILDRNVDWAEEEVRFDIGKPPYLTINRSLELRRWLAPSFERPSDLAHQMDVVRRLDGKSVPEPEIILPGDSNMDANLDSIDLTKSFTAIDESDESPDENVEPEGEKKKGPPIGLTNRRMLNEWVDFKIGDKFPDRRPVRALFRSLDSLSDENPDQFVSLWYHHGEPVMGRAWNDKGTVAASFSWNGRDFRGSMIHGVIQILFELPSALRGFDYDWRPFAEAASFDKEKEWHPVHIDYIGRTDVSPGVIFVDKKEILGKVDIKNEKASYGYNGKENLIEGPPVHTCMVLCRKARPGCKFD